MKPKYRRMLKGMKESAVGSASMAPDKTSLRPFTKDWCVYIVRCRDDSLYTGATKDLEKRLSTHNAGKGAAYTRARRPVTLHYQESGMTRSEALIREAKIKALPRREKEKLRRGL